MMKSPKRIMRTVLAPAVLAVPAVLFSGCYDDYYARRDTVSLGAGDAQATNAATHVIDPWPPHSKNTTINVDGSRVQVGMDRYQANKSVKPNGLSSGESGVGNGGGGSEPMIKN